MGDITPVQGNATPGIMLVRPSLHSPTPSNAATFKRWTIMHFNDLLNCTSSPGTKGINRALRYTSPNGELLYTIHSDNIAIWQTQPYYAVSRRLDLENTRNVEKGESAVLQGEHGFGAEPMVWDCVDAAFGIFEEHTASSTAETTAYHALPTSLLFSQGQEPGAPTSQLVTLTYNTSGDASEDDNGAAPPKKLMHVRDQALELLGGRAKKVFSSVYRHRPDAQPDHHPLLAEGADGNGAWVACVFVEGELSEDAQMQLRSGLQDVKFGVWKGEVLMC